jgi:hypothetical protein
MAEKTNKKHWICQLEGYQAFVLMTQDQSKGSK